MKGIAFGLALALAAAVSAQEKAKPTEPIATDRPDFTESGLVVPAGWLQTETGFTYQFLRHGSNFGAPEALFRYGLSSHAELRLGLPNFGTQRLRGEKFSGFGDTYLGTKLQIGPLKNGDDLSLILAAFLPTGAASQTSDSVDPDVKLCYSRPLARRTSLSVMEYGAYTTDERGRLWVFQQTASIGFELSEKIAAFTEYAGTFSARSAPDHIAHAGFTYQPTANSQYDIHFGFSMNGPEKAPFVAAGYSFRF
jgi:hypothetical protein